MYTYKYSYANAEEVSKINRYPFGKGHSFKCFSRRPIKDSRTSLLAPALNGTPKPQEKPTRTTLRDSKFALEVRVREIVRVFEWVKCMYRTFWLALWLDVVCRKWKYNN